MMNVPPPLPPPLPGEERSELTDDKATMPPCGAPYGEPYGASGVCSAAARAEAAMDARVEVELMPPTYIVWNLLCCLLCFITGIIGMIFGSQVTQQWSAGNLPGAQRASANARMMLLASVVFGLVNVPFLLLYWVLT